MYRFGWYSIGTDGRTASMHTGEATSTKACVKRFVRSSAQVLENFKYYRVPVISAGPFHLQGGGMCGLREGEHGR
jgi:hypothetical protein